MSQVISEDPVVAIVAEKHRVRASVPRHATDAEMDVNLAQQATLDNQLIKAKPVSLAGVVAGLEEAAYEMKTFPHDEDDGQKIILSRIHAAVCYLKEIGALMPSPALERKAAEIADNFLDAELDDDIDAKRWLVERISAALEEAREAGFKEAMRKRF